VVIDRTDLDAATREIKALAQGSLRFALDMVGDSTATWCQNVLASCCGSRYVPPETTADSSADGPAREAGQRQTAGSLGHLVCLTGAPKSSVPSVRVHRVPIKLFHTNAQLGSRLSKWLYLLLDREILAPPEVRFVDGGLDVVNSALNLLKNGEVSGARVVVKMKGGGAAEP